MDREIKENLARSHEEAEAWDREYWREQGFERRLDAVFALTEHFLRMQGRDPSEARIQRDVEFIKRGKR